MQIIAHRSNLDALPQSPLKSHIQNRFDQLSENTDVPPTIILVEGDDDITGPDYAFAGTNGLLSDLTEECESGEGNFLRIYEWVSYLPSLDLYEALLLVNNEDGFWIMIPKVIADANSSLHWVLTDESQGGLSDPQPL